MGYKIQSNTNNLFTLVFFDEPEYCHALMMSPISKESKLNSGTWFVLLFAVWSAPDLIAIEMAIRSVKKFGGRIQFGARPFDDPKENRVWCPNLKETYASPIWLFLKNGQVIAEYVGLHSNKEIDEIIQKSL